jgi:hypothetical protein
MLDVLITVSESTPRRFVTECQRSVRVAAAQAAYSVRVIEVPGVPGHIGRAMRNGLMKSTAPYVAWVDDDDFVAPNAFSCLTPHYAASPSAIYAREIRLLANGSLLPSMHRHHLTAFNREAISSVPLDTLHSAPNLALYEATQRGAVDELSWVYFWRVYRSAGSQLRSHGVHR